MRIALVNPYLPPPMGGIEKEMLCVGRALAGRGHDVDIVTTRSRFPRGAQRDQDSRPFVGEARISTVPGWVRSTLRGFHPSRAPLLVPDLLAAILRGRPEAALFFNIGWRLTARRAVKRLSRRIPVGLRTYYHPPGGALNRLKDEYLAGFVAAFDFGVTATEAEKRQLASAGLSASVRLHVVPPGVEVFDFEADEVRRFRKDHGLDGSVVVFHAARLSGFKGTGALLSVLARVNERCRAPVSLLLAGPCGEEDIALAVRAGVETGRVVYAGEIEQERVLRLAFAASDVFALPSRYESLGFVFLEAMAAGVPVVAPLTGGVPEIVEDGVTGVLLSDPSDPEELTRALVLLAGDAERRSALGAAGARRARTEFSWERTASRFASLFEEAARAKGGRP